MRGTQEATALAPLVKEFIEQKEAGGYSAATVAIYHYWLDQIAEAVPDVESFNSVAMSRFITGLRRRGLKHSTIHQAYRTIKTFCRYLRATGNLPHDPLAEMTVKVPQVLYDPPTAEELQAVLDECDVKRAEKQGKPRPSRAAVLAMLRNRAMILTMAESGLRRAEVLHLLVDHWDRGDRENLPRFTIRAGKGMKDRIAAAGHLTARAIREYLALRGAYDRSAFLFAKENGRPLSGRGLVQVLYRLSEKAGLPKERWLHPHAIRHLAGTSWAKAGMGLDQIRRQLGHSSYATTMKYVNLTPTDVQEAHRQASALERMGIR